MQDKTNKISTSSLISSLLLLFGLMLLFVALAGSVPYIIPKSLALNQRSVYLITSAAQSIGAFVIPSLLMAMFVGKHPLNFLSLDNSPTWKSILGMVLVFVISFPLLNQIVYWNEHLFLPESWHGLESKLREWETANAAVGNVILSSQSIGGMLSGVLVVGVLTGFGEEVFFRGALQTTLASSGLNRQSAVWISALIFSFMHFQFFGFVPRLLMGAMFGYYLLWSGSLWNSIIAHALNNSVVVVSAWLCMNGYIVSFDTVGVVANGFPWPTFLSCMVLTLFLLYGRNFFFVYKTS